MQILWAKFEMYDAGARAPATAGSSRKAAQTKTFGGYDANGRVASVMLAGSPNITILNNITYDPFGPITGWTWGNATTASRMFDTDGKLLGIGGVEN